MSIVYLNGKYLPMDQATISVEDRGWLFADGIYEVVRVYRGRPFAIDHHLDRMRDSLKAIRLDLAIDLFAEVTGELLKRNDLTEARVYWQVTRGPAPREHAFPKAYTPTVYARVDPAESIEQTAQLREGKAILEPDRRWLDCGIKSIMLLPSVLMRQKAAEAGCSEAILHRQNIIAEGAATNVFAMIDGTLRTHPADGTILDGITRHVVIQLAQQLKIPVREEAFVVDDLARAAEVFITGTTTHLTALTCCGDHTYRVGPITQQLHRAFIEHVLEVSGA